MSATTQTGPAPWISLASSAVLLPRNDIDTDQIIPARFLTTTTRAGLGVHCFADWRYDEQGAPRAEFPLNQSTAAAAEALVAGDNFGCGSSREHAPWALTDAGFRAVIAGSFADIFRTNAHKNGLLTVAIGEHIATLHKQLRDEPDTIVQIDLESQSIWWNGGPVWHFPIAPFSKRSMLNGLDEMGMLLADVPQVEAWEQAHGKGRA